MTMLRSFAKQQAVLASSDRWPRQSRIRPMDHVKISYGPKFIYLLLFNCPECNHLITFHDYADAEQTDEELKAKAYPAACGNCGFKGGLYGSGIIHSVELEWER